MTYRFRDFYIPDRMQEGITRYLESGIAPGDFLTAVICNDLADAVGRADAENIGNIPAFVAYFNNEAPANSWGSEALMLEWMQQMSVKR